MSTELDLQQQRELAAETQKILASHLKDVAKRERTSNNQKIMKALYLETQHLFYRGSSCADFDYTPINQALYGMGYRLNGKKYNTKAKRIKAMEADFAAIQMYDLTRDQVNAQALANLAKNLKANNIPAPTARRIMKSAIWFSVMGSYMKTSNPGASQLARTLGQKALFGTAIKAEDQNKVALMLQTFQFGEVVTTGKSYAKDPTGKSVGVFKIYATTSEDTSPMLLEYLASINLSFAGIEHTEELYTTPQTLVEEYRLILDIALPAYTAFQEYCTQRKVDEDNNRKQWTKEHPEFVESKKAENLAIKAEKQAKLTAYKNIQVSKGYAVVNPEGQYIKPRLDAFLRSQIDRGYKVLDVEGNIIDTDKRRLEIVATVLPTEQWMKDLQDEIFNEPKDAEVRMTLQEMKDYDPKPELKKAKSLEEHINNLKDYTETVQDYKMRHIADDLFGE